jgi:AsmA protein
MKKLLIGALVVLIVIVGGAAALPFLIDANAFKPEIEARAKEALGRELKLNGPIKLTFWPNIGLEASDVRLANAPGGQARDMATLKSLVVSVQLLPLLSKNLAIDAFVLNEPVINLEVDRQGRPNWALGSGQQPPARPAAAGSGGPPVAAIKLGDVRLVNGRLGYANLQTGEKYNLDEINAKVSLPTTDSPLAVAGAAVWNKEKIELTLNTGKLSGLLNGEKTAVTKKLASRHLTVDFAGDVTMKQTTAANGTVSIATPSIKDLAAWAGRPLADAKPGTMGRLSVAGKLAMADRTYDFADARIAVDAIEGSGALSVDLTRTKPQIKGRLDIARLDLNPYLGPEPPAKPAASGQPAGSADWSDDPIDLAGLKAFDAELALSAGEILVRKIRTGKATLTVLVKDAKATIAAAVPAPGLYKGGAELTVVANAAAAPATYEIRQKLADVDAESYLKDANDLDRLSGRLAAELEAAGRGQSQKQIVASLNGKGFLKFTDGAIKGIDLGGVARQLEEVGRGGVSFDPSRMLGGLKNLFGGGGQAEKTDFAELSGTFTIANGVIANKDLVLKSPFVRVSGEGTVSLPPKTMDYKVNIAAVATREGQGGQQAGGVGVPVSCKGAWSAPSCAPDLGAMFLGDPTKLLKGLPGLGGAAGGLPIPGVGGGGLAIPGAGGGGLPGVGAIPGLGGGAAPAAGGQPAPAAAPAAPAGGGALPGGLQNLLPGQKKP